MNTLQEIKRAIKQLEKGELIICPTDTILGLSADATNNNAVNKIITIKKRPKNKSFIILVSSVQMLKSYVEEFPYFVLDFLNKQKHPTTIIYPKGINLAQHVLAENGSVGIRIVKEGFCHELIELLGKPIVSTSINESGKTSALSLEQIDESIKEKVAFIPANNYLSSKHTKASEIFIVKNNALTKIR